MAKTEQGALNITNQMVEGRPIFRQSDLYRQLDTLIEDENNTVVAHNAKFDIGMLNSEGLFPTRVICTLKLARYLDKAGVIPQYNLQYLH